MRTGPESDSLRESLRRKILTLVQQMDFSVSTKLPSENWLAAKFDVSRSSVRAVLAELETEGKILRRQGSGTYINTKAFLLGTTLYPRIEMREIIKNGFSKIARQARMQGSKPEAILAERLQGLKVSEAQIKDALREVPLPDDPTHWDDETLMKLCGAIRERSKPMIAAMNKSDIAPAENFDRVAEINKHCVSTMAETELALKKAAAGGLIEYTPGDDHFTIKDGSKVSDGQRKALDYMAENMKKFGGTGVQKCIEDAAFDMLDLICVYPVEDETKYTDHFGRVLPDAFLVPRGSTAKDLAYRVHTDLGDKFIRAVNAKTKRTVGADYELQDGDVIRIVANK